MNKSNQNQTEDVTQCASLTVLVKHGDLCKRETEKYPRIHFEVIVEEKDPRPPTACSLIACCLQLC